MLKLSSATWVVLGCLAGTLLVIFSPWWWQGCVCAPLDIVTQLYEPWAQGGRPVQVKNHFPTDTLEHYMLYRYHAQKSFSEEGVLGWNFYKNGGTPDYANTMATSWDWTMVLHRVLPFWTAWHFGLMGQLLCALLGMYVFLRSFQYRPALCLMGTFAFSLSSHFAIWFYHRWALGGFSWAPWYLWALFRTRQGSKWGLLFPFLLALALLGGHLQYAVFHVLVVACVGLSWMGTDYRQTGKVSWGLLGNLSLQGLLAIALAALMFVPCALAYVNTLDYGLVRGGLGYPDGRLSPLLNLLAYPSFAFPFLMGSPHTFDAYKLFKSDIQATAFFGTLPVILAFVGLFVKRLHPTAKLLTAAGLLLPLTPLLGPLYQRLLVIFILGGTWLAVDFLDQADEVALHRLRRTLFWVFGIGTLLLLGLGLLITGLEHQLLARLLARIQPQIATHRFGACPAWFTERVAQFVSDEIPWRPHLLLPWLLFGVSVYGLRYLYKPTGGWSCAVAVMLQLVCYDQQWVVFFRPFGPDMDLYPATVETKAIVAAVGASDRVLVVQKRGRLPLFPLNSLCYFGVPNIVGYDSILPNGIQKHVPYLPYIGETLPSAQFLGERGVTHLITFADDQLPGVSWSLVRTAGKINIYSNALARSWYSATVAADAVALPLQPLLHQQNHRRLHLPPNTRKVAVCENWDEGWKFRTEGGPWRNMQLEQDRSMSAELSPRAAAINFEMMFDPTPRKIGMGISLLGLLAYVVYALWARRVPWVATGVHARS